MESSFGPYRIEELLGRGGMGEVYRAHDTETDRRVALKVLPEHLAQDGEYQERFRRECRAVARLREPHVVPIHRFGEIDGRLYLDMRLVEGTDLATWLGRFGAMSPAVAVSVVSQVAAALDAAHADGLVHRDVKPSNVLLAGVSTGDVDRDVFAYLFDFGIARAQDGATDDPALTRTGTMPGSLAYIAPERFAGVEGDPRADVYALACVLHQALTGRPPFDGDLATLMRAHLDAPPPRPSTAVPDLPAGLDEVVARGMAKDPRQRTATAGALAAAARAALVGARSDEVTADIGARARAGDTVVPPAWPEQSWAPTALPAPVTYLQPPGPPGWASHPSHPSHPSQPSYPQQPPPRRHRTALILLAVLATVAVICVAVALATGSRTATPAAATSVTSTPVTSTPATPEPTPTPTAPTPTAEFPTATSTSETDLLLAELPLGYGPDNCRPEVLQSAAATAFVVCSSPPSTGTGPTVGSFSRYASPDDMDAFFEQVLASTSVPGSPGVVEDCAAAVDNRALYTRVSGAEGGQMACFTDPDGAANLIWTDPAALAVGYVGEADGDAAALYDWWNTVDFFVAGR